jgi:hypothetical protein
MLLSGRTVSAHERSYARGVIALRVGAHLVGLILGGSSGSWLAVLVERMPYKLAPRYDLVSVSTVSRVVVPVLRCRGRQRSGEPLEVVAPKA